MLGEIFGLTANTEEVQHAITCQLFIGEGYGLTELLHRLACHADRVSSTLVHVIPEDGRALFVEEVSLEEGSVVLLLRSCERLKGFPALLQHLTLYLLRTAHEVAYNAHDRGDAPQHVPADDRADARGYATEV